MIIGFLRKALFIILSVQNAAIVNIKRSFTVSIGKNTPLTRTNTCA